MPAVRQPQQDLPLRRIVIPSVVVKKACAPKDNCLLVAAVKSPLSNRLCLGAAALLKKEGSADNKAAAEKEICACGPRTCDDDCDPTRGLHRVRLR